MDQQGPIGVEEILRRLQVLRHAEATTRVVQAVLRTGLLALALFVVLLIVESLLHLPPFTRTVLVLFSAAGVVGYFVWIAGKPLGRLLGLLGYEADEQTADRVGRGFPHIKDRLLNLLQLLRDREASGRLYSLDLIDASFRDLSEEVQPLDFTVLVDRSGLRSLVRFFPAVVFAIVAGLVLLPGTLGGAAYRLLHYSTEFTLAPDVTIAVEPGNAEIVKGDDVVITALVRGSTDHPIRLLVRPEGQLAFEERPLDRHGEQMYGTTLASVRLSMHYRVEAGPYASSEYLLRVLDRPVVNILRLRLLYPPYTGLASLRMDDNIGDVTAPAGTTIQMEVETTKELAQAVVYFSDSTAQALQVTGKNAAGRLAHHKERRYHLVVKDRDGVANADPIDYTLRVVSDAAPTVAIVAPGINLNVSGDEKLAVLIRASDDYGLSRLRIGHKLVQSKYEQAAPEFTFIDIPLTGRAGQEWLVPYTWDLSTLRLGPEDVVQYYAEVFDNDAVSGPKSASSAVFYLRLPSLEEVFAAVDKGHDQSSETLQQSLTEAKEAKKELDDLAREMKKPDQKMTWEDQKKAEELVRRYEEIQKRMEDVQRTMDTMLDEMQNKKVISEETLQKYQELQQVMTEMNSPEFAEAMKRLQDAMQQMSPEAMKQALQKFSFSEEQFRKSIERTLNLLKRIRIEQKMDEMLKRTEEMLGKQEELHKEMADSLRRSERKMQEAQRSQDDVREKYQKLEKELAELEKSMEEFPAEMPVKEMQDLLQNMKQEDLEKLLREISEQMERGEMDRAATQQQQAMQKMGQMMQGLQQMKQQMLQNQQRQIVNEMRRAAHDLLELSRREEELKNSSRAMDPTSQRFRENAQEQMNVLRDLGNITNRLSALSQKTFSISPEMGKAIGEAMQKMTDALQSLDQRNGGAAAQQQSGAMGALNQIAQQLQDAAQGMMQGGGQGMGMGGFLQRLQQLGGQQQGINDATRGLTPEQAAELGRLAGEQGMVRKSLEDLAREASRAGELSKLLGDLNRVAQDMREVQTDLAGGSVNPETLRKQDRILSRLLDAQRSMRERDFEKRRRAESGTTTARQSPPEIDLSTQEGRNRLQRDLLRALEEGYARDYQELIKKYFEALQR